MLSDTSLPVIKATLPVVGEHIEEIAKRFYKHMFEARPDLLDGLFNRGNQADGRQQQALAGSIAAFATMLVEKPDQVPDHLLSRVAHKHVSLGLSPDQYQIVHDHLIWAIVDVLGDAVTPEVAAAWDEVYWLMANALIAIEDRLYAQQGTVAGDVWREWEVTGRTEETEDVATFRISPADGTPAPVFRPGQYVSVQVELPDGARQIRQYSLSSAPGSPQRSITVKRVHGGDTPDGEVSRHLHAHTRPGDRLRVSAPYGDLVLDAVDAPLFLASAGIGCTPMLSMLDHLSSTGHRSPVTVVHGDRSPADHALRADHTRLTDRLPDASAHFWYENPAPGHPADRTGLVDLTDLVVPAGTHAYLCGPLPFMRTVRAQLLAKGLPAADIHYEVFGPDLWLAQA